MNLSELKLEHHPYQNDQVLLLPYLKTPGLFPDDLWPRIHARLMEDGTFSTTFPGMGMFSARDLDKYMKKQPSVLYVIKPDTLVGFGWITQSEGSDGARKAAFGFAFFRATWGTPLVRDLGFLCLAWWFQELKIEILYGSQLKTNRLAINFARNFGFKDVGDLPMFYVMGGKLADGHLLYLKKEDFMPRYEFHRFELGRGGREADRADQRQTSPGRIDFYGRQRRSKRGAAVGKANRGRTGGAR